MQPGSFFGLLALSTLALVGSACSEAEGTGAVPGAAETSGADAPGVAEGGMLSREERDALRFMREEEKLARDVYRLNASSLRVFDNIAASEQQHMDEVLGLLDRYGLEDPVAGNAEGVFANAALSTLYIELSQRAQTSLPEALRVGAEIEELDLRDLDAALLDVTHADIAAVYENLARGSRNHLRAFYRNLSMRGEAYTPRYLEEAEFLAIVATDTERGP